MDRSERLDAISEALNAALQRWADAGCPDDGPEFEARQAASIELQAWTQDARAAAADATSKPAPFTPRWECEIPPDGVEFRVIDGEWIDDYTVRVIREIEIVPADSPGQSIR